MAISIIILMKLTKDKIVNNFVKIVERDCKIGLFKDNNIKQ